MNLTSSPSSIKGPSVFWYMSIETPEVGRGATLSILLCPRSSTTIDKEAALFGIFILHPFARRGIEIHVHSSGRKSLIGCRVGHVLGLLVKFRSLYFTGRLLTKYRTRLFTDELWVNDATVWKSGFLIVHSIIYKSGLLVHQQIRTHATVSNVRILLNIGTSLLPKLQDQFVIRIISSDPCFIHPCRLADRLVYESVGHSSDGVLIGLLIEWLVGYSRLVGTKSRLGNSNKTLTQNNQLL